MPGWCNIRLWHHMYYPRRTGVRQVRRDQEGLGPPEWVTGRGLFLLSCGRRILLSGAGRCVFTTGLGRKRSTGRVPPPAAPRLNRAEVSI